jgi:hypothetical protein
VPPKPNYSFEKRQRELEKKKKKAEKAMKKSAPGGHDAPETDEPEAQNDAAAATPATPEAP